MQILSDDFVEDLSENIMATVEKSLRKIEKEYAVRNKYLSKKNACIYADIVHTTLDTWIARGLPISKIGGCLRIKTDDIDKFMEDHLM